jgi:hypothetical protein
MTRDDLFNTNASIVAALIEVPLPPQSSLALSHLARRRCCYGSDETV